jgi:hypothetical protein
MRSLEQVLEDGVNTTGEVPGAAAAYATRDGMQFLGAAVFLSQAFESAVYDALDMTS